MSATWNATGSQLYKLPILALLCLIQRHICIGNITLLRYGADTLKFLPLQSLGCSFSIEGWSFCYPFNAFVAMMMLNYLIQL